MNFWNTTQWQPSIGDPTFVGWLTVLVYAVAAFYSARIVRAREDIFTEYVRRQVFLWRFLAVVLVLLCVNKQLDLQSLFTDVARYYFKQYGLYESRWFFQKLLIASMLVVSVLIFILSTFVFWNILRPNILAIVGAIFLLAFIVVRASSFHHMDRLISATFIGFKMNWLLELTGLALIIINARSLLKRTPKKKSPASGARIDRGSID